MNEIPAPAPYDPRESAAAVLQAVFKRDAAHALAKAKILSDDLWAYGCNLNPRHIGLIFFEEPQALVPIHGGQWTAVWRPEGQGAFWGEPRDVICQQCFVERGECFPLRLRVVQARERHLGMVLLMDPEWKRRFVHRHSRSELSKFLREEVMSSVPATPAPAAAPVPAAATPAAAARPAQPAGASGAGGRRAGGAA